MTAPELDTLILKVSDEVEAELRAGALGRQPTAGYVARAAMNRLVAKLDIRLADIAYRD